MAQQMTIGRLAKAAGVAIDTVRYYERAGLMPEPPRRPSGYRSYGAEHLQRLRFIIRAKSLGFSLDEVTELLSLSGQRASGVAGVRATASARLAELDGRIAELQKVRSALAELVECCPGEGAAQACPILQALSGERT